MSDSSTIEQRLAKVEQELAALKSRVKSLRAPKQKRIDAISGSFKDDPQFAEIVRKTSFDGVFTQACAISSNCISRFAIRGRSSITQTSPCAV
jgi:Rad3-related DNA helicase